MIKVFKSENAPARLFEVGYDCDEVKRAILDDQKDKCYLCERKVTTDYQVEHIASRTYHEDKKNEWLNLFIACNYCNYRKKQYYDDIPQPNEMEFENVIEQIVDLKKNKAVFNTSADSHDVAKLVLLLGKLFNGKGICRNLMESRFWDDFKKPYSDFLRRIAAYTTNPTDENKKIVIADLAVDQTALGFKYAFLKGDDVLWRIFGAYCKWNK